MDPIEEWIERQEARVGFKLLGLFRPATQLASALARQEEWRIKSDVAAGESPGLRTLLQRLREHWPGQDERIYDQLCTGYFPGEQPPPLTAEDARRIGELLERGSDGE